MGPYLKVGIAALLVAIGAAAGWAITADHYQGELAKSSKALIEVKEANSQKDLALADQSNKLATTAWKTAQATSSYLQTQFAAHDAEIMKEHQDEIAALRTTNDALRDRSQRMFVDAYVPACSGADGHSNSAVSAAPASSSVGDGTTRVQLSATTGIALESLVREADGVADQLRSAQKILADERSRPLCAGS